MNRIVAWTAASGLATLLAAGPATAQSSPADYTFLVAAGLLCDPADSSTCPAAARSANGDSYEMSGAGTFSTQNKAVTAAGTFTHKSSDGSVLETGVWVADELVSFDSYGIAPRALMRGGRTLGPAPFGPMRSRMFSGSMPTGGLAVYRIRLLPMWGVSRTATLQVNCALGKVPDEHQTEGVRLAFEGRGTDFTEEISGRTMFPLTRSRASGASNAPDSTGNRTPAEVEP